MLQVRRIAFAILVSTLGWLTPSRGFASDTIVITPPVFDFGWCPDNAKISADFTVKNTGSEMIPITSVQPTCGCTASEFTPGALGTNETTNVSLTFNTRGYAGTGFSKSAKVKTGAGSAEYQVQLTGFVADPQAKVVPDQDGIVQFLPGSKEKKKTISIQNKGTSDATLEIVQNPAGWATLKLHAPTVKAGAAVDLDVSANPPFDEAHDTSVTLAAKTESGTSRLTIAIRTGPPPAPIRVAPSPVPTAAPSPKAAPSKAPATKRKSKGK